MGTGYMGMDETPVVENNTTPAETTETVTPTQTETVAETVTETPVQETSPTPEATITEPAKQEPQVIEKVVEKIVEKYPEFKDESAKQLFEQFVEGNTDAVYNYLEQIKKNYDTMSDVDVVRASLADKNPQWTQKDVELEMRAEYGQKLEKYDLNEIDKELEPDVYKEAVAHNKQVEDNMLRLERAARDGRIALKEKQKTIELPKITKEETPKAPEGLTQEQIDESKRLWAESAAAQVPNLADFKFQVGDAKNPEEVVFNVTPEEKAARVEAMKTWNGADFMKSRGWQNEDGQFNLLKIAEDVHTLENLPKIIKSVYSQAKTSTTKEVVSEIKNIDLSGNPNTSVAATPADVGALIWQ